MGSSDGSRTSPTLLGKLRYDPADAAAWSQFVQRYGPKVYGWCRRWHLQSSDAEDVTHEVLLKLVRKMRIFSYDRSLSFRGWLRAVARNAWHDFVDERRDQRVGLDGAILATAQAGDDFLDKLDDTFERELLEEAMARVQLRVQPHTWEAFRLTAIEELSGEEVAPRVGMKVAQVYVAKCRVQKMLESEVLHLRGAQSGEKGTEV